jgi:hypothetical protein
MKHLVLVAVAMSIAATMADVCSVADDVSIFWQCQLLNSIASAGTFPPLAARNMALLSTAMYNAHEKINDGPDAIVAANYAAYTVMSNCYPLYQVLKIFVQIIHCIVLLPLAITVPVTLAITI